MAFSTDSDDTSGLLDKIAAGDSDALECLLRNHRPFLKRVIQMRMEPALRARVDVSDVVQETQILITKGIDYFIKHRPTAFRIWIRRKGLDQLIDQRRRHIGAEMRSVLKEENLSDVSSLAIARKMLSNTPSKILGQIEFRERVHGLIEQLGEKHREMLVLRHAEELSNAEVADLLELDPNTARQRYGRALRQLAQLFEENGIGRDGLKE
ncbi:MAG: sigma-70 family RNA polymerase sigma factor [Planctomycetales bacterium]|nr:sigma-70 family RNA polymerase sigma factor [Planctomycetales bacterium]